MSWKILTKDVDPNNPFIKKLFEEATAAAPESYFTKSSDGTSILEDTVAMLPRKPLNSRCRLCGKDDELTKEHIPPKSSGNKLRHEKLTLDDWLKDKMEENSDSKHQIEQGGIFGYTLCKDCNSLTGRLYGTEYKKWADRAKEIINGFEAGTIAQLNTMVGPFAWEATFASKETGSVKPGAFVRQVLSCMCSLSGSWDLAEKYPELRRIILEQSTEPLPVGMKLGMSFYVGPKVRMGGPQLRIDAKTEIWRWCQEIAFPPFAFLLVVASNKKDAGEGLMIDKFTLLAPSEEQYFEGTIELGFGWSPYPGDYRSQTTILAARSKIVK